LSANKAKSWPRGQDFQELGNLKAWKERRKFNPLDRPTQSVKKGCILAWRERNPTLGAKSSAEVFRTAFDDALAGAEPSQTSIPNQIKRSVACEVKSPSSYRDLWRQGHRDDVLGHQLL